jgi:hypothetical protein
MSLLKDTLRASLDKLAMRAEQLCWKSSGDVLATPIARIKVKTSPQSRRNHSFTRPSAPRN